MNSTIISGIGSYVPSTCMTNDQLPAALETSDQWIRERTGITQRHLAADNEYTSDLGAHAARAALHDAGLHADDIDLIILATATPDQTFPASATQIQAKLGITKAAALDVNAACSGFVYGLHMGDALMRTGQCRHALVIGAETMSRVVDWEDRRTAILFGDGAGACVLSASKNHTGHGIINSMIASDGSFAPLLQTNGGISTTQQAGVLSMEGKEVFRHAVEKMTDAVLWSLDQAKLSSDDLRYVIPHQANARILAACAKKLGLSEAQTVMSVDQHANTSSASIPLALDMIKKRAGISPGDYVMFTALGAGFTWGSCLVKW